MSSTIIAQCTPNGSGAIALLRISGPDSFKIADNFLKLSKDKIINKATHTIHFAKAHIDNKIIDHVMVLVMQAPKTFTGEQTVEITCHNNQLIIESIIQEAIKFGARQALPGEFAQQAVLNKKIDFLQAESINELIHAQTPQAISQSLSQIQGSLSSIINNLQNKLLQALALCESSFEFLDDENINFDDQIKKLIEETILEIKKLKNNNNLQKHIRQGYRVVLLGSVNAGKSSLFNALIEEEKAIVTPIAGTTRDIIESTIILDGQAITLVDTAGLRKTKDIVESIGIKRSQEEAIKADLILFLHENKLVKSNSEQAIYKLILEQFQNKLVDVLSKTDQITEINNYFQVSVLNNTGIKELKLEITKKINNIAQINGGTYLLNKRHFHSLASCEIYLEKALKLLHLNPAYELIAINLNQAIQNIGQLTGKTVTHDVMDMIFRQFCVGK